MIDIEIIIPTVTMCVNAMPGVFMLKETWNFRDCTIIRTNKDRFSALIFVRIRSGEFMDAVFYGFIHQLKPTIGIIDVLSRLDIASGGDKDVPQIFEQKVTWANVGEGHAYTD